jgi:uncharacterized protein YndB with AHSA1/START domain
VTDVNAVQAEVHILASPDVVFPYFTDAALLTKWMGQWADLQPVPGGLFAVDVNGAPIRGKFVVVDPPNRIVFTWGTAGSREIPPGSTTVEVTFAADKLGTLVQLAHRDLPAEESSKHLAGWRFFLSVLATTNAAR